MAIMQIQEATKKSKKKKSPEKKDRKPDYDEKEIPKVLEGPVSPLSLRKDYDAPGCGCMNPEPGMVKEIEPIEDMPEVPETIEMPEAIPEEPMAILVCPDCESEAPFKLTPPPGIPMGQRTFHCRRCGSSVSFPNIGKDASSGKYRVI